MEEDKIIIVDEIKKFKFIKREWYSVEGKYNVDLKANKIYHLDALIIFYSSNGKYIEQNIYWNLSKDTKVADLISNNFSTEFLKVVSLKFNLSYTDGAVKLKNGEITATLSVKKEEKKYFMAIYSFDDGESRREPNLYIYGIWEVKLSKEFEQELYYSED